MPRKRTEVSLVLNRTALNPGHVLHARADFEKYEQNLDLFSYTWKIHVKNENVTDSFQPDPSRPGEAFFTVPDDPKALGRYTVSVDVELIRPDFTDDQLAKFDRAALLGHFQTLGFLKDAASLDKITMNRLLRQSAFILAFADPGKGNLSVDQIKEVKRDSAVDYYDALISDLNARNLHTLPKRNQNAARRIGRALLQKWAREKHRIDTQEPAKYVIGHGESEIYIEKANVGSADILEVANEIRKPHEIKMLRTETDKSKSRASSLVRKIRKATLGSTITFEKFQKTVDDLLNKPGSGLALNGPENYFGLRSFAALKEAAHTFLTSGLANSQSDYLHDLAGSLEGKEPKSRLNIFPELIWAFFMEEGHLVQTMNAICLRFQNRRLPQGFQALASLDIDPLRPLNNLLWGFIQDDQFKGMFPRRVYEYDHQLGLRLKGKAVPALQPADSRTNFIGSFNNLLRLCAKYYAESSNTMVYPDGYPILNALKDMHVTLAEGAGNQFGDMAWTARQEFLIQQWLLARPEIREFLRGRNTVLYPEPWMGAVDAMNKMQGWTDVSVRHYRDLAYTGEQIVLTIRHYRWDTETNEDEAKAWVEDLKSDIQTYIQSYWAVTGTDLTATVVARGMEKAAPPSYGASRRIPV